MSRAPFLPAPAAYVAGWPAVVLAEFLVAEPGGIESWCDERGIPEASRAGLRATVDAIRMAGAAWQDQAGGSARGTGARRGGRRGPSSGPMDTNQAADVLGLTERAVRRAAAEGRLPARKVRGRWLVELPDDERKATA